jgi:hypothetical protein
VSTHQHTAVSPAAPQAKHTSAPVSSSPDGALPEVQLALAEPHAAVLTPRVVQALQRTHGNHYVQRLVAESRAQQAARPVAVTRAPNPRMQRALHLMSIATFKAEKAKAATTTTFGFKRSTKDYEKLYTAYDKAIGTAKLDDGRNVLNQVNTKIGRMDAKTYWRPGKKQAFFDLLRGSYTQESDWLTEKKRQSDEAAAMAKLSGTIIDAFGAVGAHHVDPERALIFDHSDTEGSRKKERDRQYAQMINEALVKVMGIDVRTKPIVVKQAFVDQLVATLYPMGRITFLDVMNEIATLLPTHGLRDSTVQSKTMQQAINAITASALSPEDKIVEVAKMLWGSFDWYVRKENEEDKGDHFIHWLTNDLAPEPSGANRMNCWEGAIFVLYKAGRVSKPTLKAAYRNVRNPGVGVAYSLLSVDAAMTMWTDDAYNGRQPNKGDIVHMWTSDNINEPHHVVLALGQTSDGKDKCMSLWSGVTGGIMGMTTIQNLISEGDFVKVEYSTPTFGL